MAFSQLSEDMLSVVLTRDPDAIEPWIKALCAEIAPGETPQFIRHDPFEGSIVRECYFNVLNQVERKGGELVFGWAIWEWPRVFIEAEHHAVWLKDGELIDVTPHECDVRRVLFLPDPTATYDFEGGTRRNNYRRPISHWPVVRQWLEANERIFYMQEERSVGREYHFSGADIASIKMIGEQILDLRIDILLQLANTTSPNDPCFCGGGAKFKKCCASQFR